MLGESAREVYGAWQGRRMGVKLPAAARGSMGAVALQMAVPARATRTLSLSLSWIFPNRDFNHYRVGHAYSSVHSSSAEAAGAAIASLPDMVNSTAAWHSSFFNSSLPPFLADTLVNTLSTWRTGMYFANKDWRQWETYDCVDTDPVECDASRSLPLVIMYLLRSILMSTWGF